AVTGLTGANAISSGYDHACALLSDHTMRCWGSDIHGQLGDGNFADSSTGPVGSAVPVAVSGITSAVAITTGAYHTCAILADGSVRCWGLNGQAQLGDGGIADSSTAVVVGGIT